MPEIKDLITKSEAAEIVAAQNGDWLVSQEILYRLRTLHDESGDAATFRRYDAMLDEVNKRITLLAQYAPRELWRLRKAYADKMELTRVDLGDNASGKVDLGDDASGKVDPGKDDARKPFPEFNEAFADDCWSAGASPGTATLCIPEAVQTSCSVGAGPGLACASIGHNALSVMARMAIQVL